MKKLCFLVLALLPLLLFSQSLNDDDMFPGDDLWEEEVYPELDSPEYGMNGMIGTITVGGITYSQIRLMPELAFWKLGFGLDIDLLIDSSGKIRKEDWDEWQDIARKILYIRFADRFSPFYFKIGSIPGYTLGHGMIFDDFSNMLRYPTEKNIGGYIGFNTPYSGLGFEVYTHDVYKNDIIAGRVFVKPLKTLNMGILSNLRVGANIGGDRNQYGKYPDTDGDGYPDVYDKFPYDRRLWLDSDDDGLADDEDIDLNGNGILDHPDQKPFVNTVFPVIHLIYPNYPFDTAVFPDSVAQYLKARPLWIYSVDYELPFFESENLRLSHYAEFATIKDHGQGLIFPGFGAKFYVFDAKLEMRNFSANFLPGYFNNLYEEQRSEVVYSLPDEVTGRRIYSLSSKDSTLDAVRPTFGWFGYIRANIYNMVLLKLAYQDMYGTRMTTGKSLWAKLSLTPEVLPRLKEASVYYGQTNVPWINFRYPRNTSAQVVGRLSYGISDRTNLVGKYTEHYTDLNDDGRIKGKDEIIEVITFGVEFEF
ncbi:MAG: hypothetical protein U1B83_02575, partial [Candidatus Cloacimonadaceae bacterium]|nr:hypothetical protein [Candidatus Cloacimonadaceae bacterium]